MTDPSRTLDVTYHLVQAQNLEQFRNAQTGLRIIGKHYWYNPPNNKTVLADWITPKTDVAWLKTAIAKGTIYIKED